MPDNRGVLELPLRMVVTLVIGSAALIIILSFILQPCLFPKSLQVSWHPSIIESDVEKEIIISVYDPKGKPVSGATVMISGLGTVGVNKTNGEGEASISIRASLPEYRSEGYLNLRVKVNRCYEDFYQENAIKVVWKEV